MYPDIVACPLGGKIACVWEPLLYTVVPEIVPNSMLIFFLEYQYDLYELLVLIIPILQYANKITFIVLNSVSRKCFNSILLFQDFFILTKIEFWNLPQKYLVLEVVL